jgi:signal transduction histidine kinase
MWGLAVVGSWWPEALPVETEARVAEFAELVATAIAAATTRAELIASRARIVTAADDARHHLERDLHDGAQQRLVSLALQTADRTGRGDTPTRGAETAAGADHLRTHRRLRGAAGDLPWHPSGVLSSGGLVPAFEMLARRCTVPVDLDLAVDQRLPEPVEVAAYYVLAEALTNTAKHAHATLATVRAQITDDHLRLSIRDNGIGGADHGRGSGFIGLIDRVEALGGQIRIVSPSGTGTALH